MATVGFKGLNKSHDKTRVSTPGRPSSFNPGVQGFVTPTPGTPSWGTHY